MKKITLMTVAAMGLVGVANAAVIYEATTANSTLINNAVNETGTMTLTGATPDLLLTNPNGLSNSGGFTSSSNIQTLNGGVALTSADTVIMKVTVDSITGGSLRSNGFEFGMAQGTVFRTGSANLIAATEVNHGGNDAKIQVTSLQDIGNMGFDTTEASIYDGFTYTLTANEAGYTFLFEDIIVQNATGTYVDGATSASFSGTWAAGTFAPTFNTGHFYTVAQKFSDGAIVVDYSEASIEVIPEPATLGLVAAFGGAILFIRRRLMI